jgi:hypothetical protein
MAISLSLFILARTNGRWVRTTIQPVDGVSISIRIGDVALLVQLASYPDVASITFRNDPHPLHHNTPAPNTTLPGRVNRHYSDPTRLVVPHSQTICPAHHCIAPLPFTESTGVNVSEVKELDPIRIRRLALE